MNEDPERAHADHLSLLLADEQRRVELGTINEMHATRPNSGSGSGHRILKGLCKRHGGTYERTVVDGLHYARATLPRSPRPEVVTPRSP